MLIGDHTETVDIEYDPKIVSYGELLKMFWENHDPSSRYSNVFSRSLDNFFPPGKHLKMPSF